MIFYFSEFAVLLPDLLSCFLICHCISELVSVSENLLLFFHIFFCVPKFAIMPPIYCCAFKFLAMFFFFLNFLIYYQIYYYIVIFQNFPNDLLSWIFFFFFLVFWFALTGLLNEYTNTGSFAVMLCPDLILCFRICDYFSEFPLMLPDLLLCFQIWYCFSKFSFVFSDVRFPFMLSNFYCYVCMYIYRYVSKFSKNFWFIYLFLNLWSHFQCSDLLLFLVCLSALHL